MTQTNFNRTDNVFTLQLPGSDLVFTRYLYVKDEVRLALLQSILSGDCNAALFWGYELFCSGFKHEFFNLIWKIYYDFFATSNSFFETYLMKFHADWLNEGCVQDSVVSCVIENLLLNKQFNCDIFYLRTICDKFEIETPSINTIDAFRVHFKKWIEEKDYRTMTQWLLNIKDNEFKIKDIYESILDVVGVESKLTKSKVVKLLEMMPINVNCNLILLVHVMRLFTTQNNKIKKNKNIVIEFDDEDTIEYQTICVSDCLKHYQVLEKACKFEIDEFKYLSLFKLNRLKYDLRDKYFNNWLYHASFSPIWYQRIKDYKGYPDFTKQIIKFREEPDDDLMQQFHQLFGMEPDEQKLTTQEKSIQEIKKINNWTKFNEKFNKNSAFEIYEEELEELDSCTIVY